MEPSNAQGPQKTPHHDEKKPLLVQYGKWSLVYLYQFAVINPVLAVVIALLIVVLFAVVIPVIFSKLFLFV